MRFVEYIQNHKLRHIGWGVVLGVLALMVYFPALSVGFLSDDWHAVSVAKNTENIFTFFGTNIVGERVGSTYGPVFNLVMYLEYHLFHLHPAGYHLVNILLLGGTAWILSGLVFRLFRNTYVAAAAAILFIALPSHVETVTWISGVPHLLATLLYVAALYWYSVYSSTQHRKYYIAAFTSIAASLLTKEIGITFIIAFACIDWWNGRIALAGGREVLRNSFYYILKRYVPLAVLIICYLLARKYATGIVFGYYGDSSLDVSLVDSVKMGVKMTIGMFWSYPWRDIVATGLISNQLLAILFVGVLGGVIWIYRNYVRAALVVMVLYVVALIPYVSLEYNAVSNEGERYTYLPSVFAALGVAGAVYIFAKHLKRSQMIYAVLIASLVFIFVRSIVIKNDEWVRAGEVVRETLSTIQSLNLNPMFPVVFVGLPDRFEGAQVMRNGTFLALEMMGYGTFTGDRILASPLLPRTYAKDSAMVVLEFCGATTATVCIRSATSVSRIFTGLPKSEVYGVEATLEGFNREDQMGEVIRLLKKNPNVQVVYFNHNAFNLWEG